MSNFIPFPQSTVTVGENTYQLARSNETGEKFLVVRGSTAGFQCGFPGRDGATLFPLLPVNAAELRARLPWLRPVPLGLQTSFGFGDRLGLATPGHVRAIRDVNIAPIFAQQSVRENARTGRTPQQVIDDAMWGLFQEGWQKPWGADADHLKSLADLESFTTAGYTFYTFDLSDFVDNQAQWDALPALWVKYTGLPWDELESSPEAMKLSYTDCVFGLDGLSLTFDEITLLRASVKYGRALAHIVKMYQALKSLLANRDYDLEISLDESDTPTSPHEHFFIAKELHRLGVGWVSLAPRFVGRFEKGVDYIGDLSRFEAELKQHVVVMQYFGNYKFSLHSGSDKFSLYPILARHSTGKLHVKTAGTSYLEALRVVADVAPGFFRQIFDYCLQRFSVDRQSYHVSAKPENIPPVNMLKDAELPGLLNAFDSRQILHVTFGSVLDRFGSQLKALLTANEPEYSHRLEEHFQRHLLPISEFLSGSDNRPPA